MDADLQICIARLHGMTDLRWIERVEKMRQDLIRDLGEIRNRELWTMNDVQYGYRN